MRTVAIVQARMSSTRLPGKVLLPLARGTVLSTLLARLAQANRVDQIVVATSDHPSDDRIADATLHSGVLLYRGSLLDVLSRFVGAMRMSEANTVIRVTADCPLVDPDLVDRMIDEYDVLRRSTEGCDYLSNSVIRSFPRGLDVEIFDSSALQRADIEAQLPHQREHVTPFLYQRGSGFRVRNFLNYTDLSHLRWTLDTQEDYQFLQAVFAELGDSWSRARMSDVLAVLNAHPEYVKINRHVEQKTLHD